MKSAHNCPFACAKKAPKGDVINMSNTKNSETTAHPAIVTIGEGSASSALSVASGSDVDRLFSFLFLFILVPFSYSYDFWYRY